MEKKQDMIHYDCLKNLFSQSSCATLHWFLSTSRIQVADPVLESRGIQNKTTPGLGTEAGLSHDNTMCGFLSWVGTPTLQKQLQKVAISTISKHIRLKCQSSISKSVATGRESKRTNSGFFAGALGFTSIMVCLLISELLCLPLCLISGVPEWLRDQWSSWGSQLAGERSKGLWGIKK